MRQAGRYLQALSGYPGQEWHSRNLQEPQLAAEVTLQPVEIFDVDAAIIFADLLLPVEPMGLKLSFIAGEGPCIENPITEPERYR